MNSISQMECTALTLHNPLEMLFAQYRADREGVEKIAGYVDDAKQMHYFFAAAAQDNRHLGSATEVFKLDPAIKALDADYWQRAMFLTDVLEYMPAEKRNKWHEQISKHKTPPFEKESVTATLIQMLNNRAQFMAERVDGLFKALSGTHVTNQPQAFGKRFIMDYMLSYGRISYQRANYIHDLRCVIGKFMGRNIPNSNQTCNDLDAIHRDGQWNEFDGGAFKVRLYLKGTAHMEVHPDIAWQLNKVLAHLYPFAIPAEFRTKPKKKLKEHKLHYDLVSYETVKELDRGLTSNSYDAKNTTELDFQYKEPPSEPTISVMERLGGVSVKKNVWEFGYKILPIIKELSRTGRIPEQKSHQFYRTPTEIAHDAIAKAKIQHNDTCLEPSAGLGGLADYMPKHNTVCVEVSSIHCEVLKAKGHNVECSDFIKWGYKNAFDVIVMNPPFNNGRYIEHIKHAANMLSKDGRLVAILPASNKGKIIVEGMTHDYGDIYKNKFSDASVDVVIVLMYY